MSGRGQTTDRKRKLLLVNFSIVKMASPSMRCRRSAWDSASTGGFRYNRLAPHCLCLSIHLIDKVRVLFYMVAQMGHRPYPWHCHIVPYLLRQRRHTKRRLPAVKCMWCAFTKVRSISYCETLPRIYTSMFDRVCLNKTLFEL